MIPETEVAFTAYLQRQAQLNGTTLNALMTGKKFTVTPAVAQTIEKRIQESSAFLMAVNIVPVVSQIGEKIGLGVRGPIASTTDTTQKDRDPQDVSDLTANDYHCQQTNFDTALGYAKIDMWATFPNFQTLLRNAILQRQALDRIMIGWNGVSRAKTSDPITNPLLQDVNIGWLQQYRDNAPARVMAGGKDPTKVVIGPGGDYENLDAAVMDVVANLIASWYQDDPKLVVVCGRQLLADKYFPLVNKAQDNTESLAADVIISQKRIGGLQAVRVPYFPPNALMVTRLDNLSIYWQKSTRRRLILDNAKRDRIENYESVNEAYVVEDYEGGCIIENIEMQATPLDGKGPVVSDDMVHAAAAKVAEAIMQAFQRVPATESARQPDTLSALADAEVTAEHSTSDHAADPLIANAAAPEETQNEQATKDVGKEGDVMQPAAAPEQEPAPASNKKGK